MILTLKKKLILKIKEIARENGVYVDSITDDLPPYQIYEPASYTDGPEGFIKWCEENVCIPIYPEGSDISVWCPIKDLPDTKNPDTGRSYKDFWDAQKEIVRNALRMYNERFIYKLIVLCWPRGDGKSLLACLIQLWKFFNWTRQNIVLGANSKEQIQFVHYDIMRDIINNSPNLLTVVGKKYVQEKLIRIFDDKGNQVSVIRAISSFSGIVSNITGYTFSEIFDMKNPKFFTQLDGSIRNIPNALGVIDSTVSAKDHILYSLFKSFIDKKVKSLYFSYRSSKNGVSKDYWNPMMTQTQLDDYKAKFMPADFGRYFLNTWSSGAQQIFTAAIIESMSYIGCNKQIGNFFEVVKLLNRKYELLDKIDAYNTDIISRSKVSIPEEVTAVKVLREDVADIDSKMIHIENYIKMTDNWDSTMVTLDQLNEIGDLFDTDFAILTGVDRADPMKKGTGGAKTMFTCVAKGLAGSRHNYQAFDSNGKKAVPNYLYILLHIVDVSNDSLESIKECILACDSEYEGIDSLCGERWGLWDIVPWCEEHDIMQEIIHPSYERQKAAFSELYLAARSGRFKAPTVYVPGAKEADVLREEMRVFYDDSDKKWYGSPEKVEKGGIQDDCMFSLGWCLYGGRELGVDSFRERKKKKWFGVLVKGDNLGNYA